MEQIDSIPELFGIKRYRSVAAVCAIYPDAQIVETHLYLKLASFCVNILIIVLFRVVILVKKTISDCNFRSSSYNIKKVFGTENIPHIGRKHEEPASIQSRATIGPPVKRHSNGVSLAGR